MLRNILKLGSPFSQVSFRKYAAKPSGGKKINTEEVEIKIDVEKDSKKLLLEVCGTNLLVEGGENVKIKPDCEYPDWLWEIPIGEPLPLEKLDPNTKIYWVEYNKMKKQQRKFLDSIQPSKTVHK